MRKAEPRRMPPGVHRKTAKGRSYYYFDTGARRNGKPVLKRLPDIRDIEFGPAYSAALTAKGRVRAVSTAITVPQLIDLYERSPEFRLKSASTQRTYLIYLPRFATAFPTAPAEAIERKDILRLIDSMGATTGAANMTLAVIGALYTWGRKRQHVTTRPTAEIDSFETTDYEPWPEWLIEKALEDKDPFIRAATGLLYFTAQRIGDVANMRWSDIRDGVIHVTQQKTGAELEIPIHSSLLPILPAKEAMTILHHKGRAFKPPSIRTKLQAWAAGHGQTVVAHGLRKNAVNALLEAGCSVGETSAISGQSLQIVEHYAKRRNRSKLASAAIIKWQGNAS